MLIDNHGRAINYLRLAVTDRCNLRCFYCMPEHGLDWLARAELMTYEEMLRLVTLLSGAGVTKVRITGGEPFARKGIIDFMQAVADVPDLKELTLTTNGVLARGYVATLRDMGVRTVNLSLDTLDRGRFHAITRRDELPEVLATMYALLDAGIAVKLNAVVMSGKNTDDILPLAELTKHLPIAVRYIEEMPFNGTGTAHTGLEWDQMRILETLRGAYGEMERAEDGRYSTSVNYKIANHAGTIGIIAAYTRSFCGTCNRLRITPTGMLKTCLYDGGVLQVKDLMRAGATDDELLAAITAAIGKRAANGHEAEQQAVHASMATIGG